MSVTVSKITPVISVPTVASPTAQAANGSSAAGSSSGVASNLQLTPEERQLFCSHNIASLKQLAEDKRNQSDDKKEELRQLVGIRYRVLIETADSISAMSELAATTKSAFELIQTAIPNIQHKHNDTSQASANAPLSQLELLLQLRSYALAPVEIWNYLDHQNFEAAISLFLAMQRVEQRLANIEHWPTDSEKDHEEIKNLIQLTAQKHAKSLPAGASSSNPSPSSQSLAAALSSFFHLHRSYYEELPSLISLVASQRLQHRSLSTRSYADALVAVSMVSRVSSSGRAGNLLHLFLDCKTQQIQQVLHSAQQALLSFRKLADDSKVPIPSPTPVLTHASQQLLLILQYTLLDVAYLFASIQTQVNPHAAFITKSNELVKNWKESNVHEKVIALLQRINHSPSSSAAQLKLEMPSAELSQRVGKWLQEQQALIQTSFTQQLLPYLFPVQASKRQQGAKAAWSPCMRFASVRDSILRAANWDDIRSAEREGEKEENEKAAKDACQPSDAGKVPDDSNEEKASLVKQKSVERKEIEPSTHVVSTSAASVSPADQLRLTRKKMQERWDEACTLLFGRASAVADGAASPFAAPFNLFDYFFLPSLQLFSVQLLDRAFEKLTLDRRVGAFLKPRLQVKTVKQPVHKKLLTQDEDALQEEEEEKKQASESARSDVDSSALSNRTPAEELVGSREDEVQQIVSAFQRQLQQLGKECGAILECTYLTQQVSTTTLSSFKTAAIAPVLFPTLQRYLQEELRPLLTKKYNTLVEKLVEQLRKKLADLESSVMRSMAEMSSWRSRETTVVVEQAVFIGRICHQLTKQLHLLSLDTLLQNTTQQQPSHSRSTSQFASSPSAASLSLASNPIYASLNLTSKTAFRIWSRYIAAVLSEDFNEELEKHFRLHSVLSTQSAKFSATFFQQLGSNKNSAAPGGPLLGLHLPVQPSSFISQLLFQFHKHYYHSFGFSIQYDILGVLLTDVTQSLLNIFDKEVIGSNDDAAVGKVLDKLPSNSVLQLMFDVHYLFAMLRLPAPSNKSLTATGPQAFAAGGSSNLDARARYSRLLTAFDNHLGKSLDQIDWMTSKASYYANLHAALSRASMLHGILSKANPFPSTLPPQGGVAPPSTATAAADASPVINILPLSAPATRVLPLSASLYPSKHPQPVAASAAAAAKLALSSSIAAANAPTVYTTASLLAGQPSSHTISATANTPASASALGAAGLSFSKLSSDLSSQLSLAKDSANVKAIGDLGSSLLGKLSSNSLWGKKQ